MTSNSKVAIVTGAGSGIGKASALALLQAGYAVALAGRRLERLEAAVAEAGPLGSQALIVHTSMFMQLLAAQHAGNEQLASFYAERFPPDVKKAYEAWLAQKPFENRAADPHPFVPNLYQVRGVAEAAAARTDSAAKVAQAREAGNRSGQYLANTVLFAAVLFFAGTAGKFEQPRVRLFAAAFGVALFLFAAIRMLLMPAA